MHIRLTITYFIIIEILASLHSLIDIDLTEPCKHVCVCFNFHPTT